MPENPLQPSLHRSIARFCRALSAASDRQSRWQFPRLKCMVWGLAVGSGLTVSSLATPVRAAEQLTIRLGPLQQSVSMSDLEQFAETGEIPPSLRLYAPLLNADVRYMLNNRLHLDPNVGDKLVEDLLHSSAGERFVNTMQVAIPNATVPQLQQALMRSARQTDGMSLLGFLRAFPTQCHDRRSFYSSAGVAN